MIEKINIHSSAMNKEIPTLIVLPEQYQSDGKVFFPTLYLLHGYSGDCLGYYENMQDLEDLSTQYGIIFVCPDGGYNSWYLDSPYGKNCLYETFISIELIGHIDSNYKTFKAQKLRAITGLSMGGHGALYNAIRNPNVFGAAGSMSGGVDFTPFPTEWELIDRLGSYFLNKKRWESHCVINMTNLIKEDFPLIIDCGVDDFFMQVNRNFHQKLLAEKISHDYTERAGGHDWDYWANATRHQIYYFYLFFRESYLL